MARVTIEDCLEKVDDRFELVALAAQRAKDIASGAELTMERNGEKDTVISLREIAEENVKIEDLRENIISAHQNEKNILENYVVAANSNDDEFNIDEEEADIKSAMSEITAEEDDDDLIDENEALSDATVEAAEEMPAEEPLDEQIDFDEEEDEDL